MEHFWKRVTGFKGSSRLCGGSGEPRPATAPLSVGGTGARSARSGRRRTRSPAGRREFSVAKTPQLRGPVMVRWSLLFLFLALSGIGAAVVGRRINEQARPLPVPWDEDQATPVAETTTWRILAKQ